MSASRSVFALLPGSGDLLELVADQDKPDSLNILCRVHLEDPDKNVQRMREKAWNNIMELILKTVRGIPKASCHVCKSYFLKGDRMVFGWSIQLKHRMPRIFINTLNRAFSAKPVKKKAVSAPPPSPRRQKKITVTEEDGQRIEIEEIPLKGGIPPTSFRKGKGAYAVRDAGQ